MESSTTTNAPISTRGIESNKKGDELLTIYLEYLQNQSKIRLDKWQNAVINTDGSVTIRAGRQVGKSTVVSIRAVKFALTHPKTITLIIAASQRQSSLLFEKVKGELDYVHEIILESHGNEWHSLIKSRRQSREARLRFELEYGIYKDIPTQTKIMLKNGSVIYSLPAGKTGYFIRGFTVDHLIVDEAAYINEQVWVALKPMIAVSQQMRGLGWITLLSTPFGKGGFFYHSFTDDDYKQFHVSSETCSRIPPSFLTKEREKLTKLEYAQEYLAEFIDEYHQYFNSDLLKSRMNFIIYDFNKEYSQYNAYCLGVDVARYGDDENAFVVLEFKSNTHQRVIYSETTKNKSLVDTCARIIALDQKFHFRRIFTDDTGVGGGVTDLLREKLGTRCIGINNASRSVDDTHNRKILKEDLYSNALMLLQNSHLSLINDLSLLKSLKSMTFEYTLDRNLRIYGKYSHLSEAFVRACWYMKQKGLKLFIR